MTTITATPEPQTASVDVLVTAIVGFTAITILRTDIDGRDTPLRGSPFTVLGGQVAAIDGEAPFGTPIRYTVAEDTAATTTVVLDVDEPWLTHPIAPFLSMPCVVRDDTDWTYPGRTYVFDVIGRAEPVYTWYRRSTRAGTLTLNYADVQERTNIRVALETGAPMLLRFPEGYEQFSSSYIGVGEARVVPNGVGAKHGSIEMDYVVVAAPPSEVAVPSLAWQWDDVPVEFASWSALVAEFNTWNEVLFYNPATPNAYPTEYPTGQPLAPPPLGT